MRIPFLRSLAARGAGPHIDAGVEQLVVAASLFWAFSANRAFFGAALGGRDLASAADWRFGAALLVLVVALHALLLALVATRRTVKPLLAVLTVTTALASHYTGTYGIYLDAAMLRNVARTDFAEARELLGSRLALHLLLYAGLPLALLWRVRVVRRPWRRAVALRAVLLAAAAAAIAGALLAAFQPVASLVRNHREVRYLVTPANYLWSIGSVAATQVRGAARPRRPIGLDAVAGPSWAARRKPLVVVLVVGETARAASWGLSGYGRQTTPQLARLGVTNFADMRSCGTSTEVSLPCMFAPVGRQDYDEERIRGQQSLLHMLARAGVAVHWRDNQSGCKGVCDGLPGDTVSSLNAPGLCDDGRCLDEGLVQDLDQRLRALTSPRAAAGTHLWVMHMLGNHGPAYFRRYPPAFAAFRPDCRDDDLSRCGVDEIVNAYDNALLYTDHVLATTIARLRDRADEIDSALVYVSDHGESLGEHGLFLHGVPYPIAPDVQTRVPMVFWASAGFERGAGLAAGCLQPELRRRAAQPASHDHLFHTLLGLLDVHTALRAPSWDLVDGCRAQALAAAR